MKPTPILLALALCCLALAGCTKGPPAVDTDLRITFAGLRADIEADVDADENDRPSEFLYTRGFAHGDFYSAHDQLEQWAQESGHSVEVDSSEGFPGFYVLRIDGHPADTDTGYWLYSVNGLDASFGMSDMALADGDEVEWRLELLDANATPAGTPEPTPTGQAPGTSSTPGASGASYALDAIAPTAEDRARLTGNGPAGPATLQVRHAGAVVHTAAVTLDAAFQLDIPLGGFGTSTVEVYNADGAHAQVPAVRLASFTMEVDYGPDVSHPPTSDVVAFNPDVPPAQAAYDGKERPAFPIVHDVMAAWETQTGSTIEYSYSDSFGYGVSKVNGAGNPVTSSLPPWWCYQLNGETGDLGISLQPVQPGDVVRWELGACA